MLMPGVEWNREGTASFPFKHALRGIVVPYGCRAPPRCHGDNLFIELALWLHAFPGQDLGNVSVSHHLVGERTDRTIAIFALPVLEFLRAHILYERTADDRHAFGFDPFFVRAVLVYHELDIRVNFEFFNWSGHGDYLPAR